MGSIDTSAADATSGGVNATTPGAVTVPFPTLQNLSVEWAFTGDANANARVDVRYRAAGTSNWSAGMSLRRVAAGSNGGGSGTSYSWALRHSGSILDLQPATTYDIELTLVDPDGGGKTVITQATTRAVPAAMAGGTVKPVTPSTLAGVLAAANLGDIIELGAGNYSGFSIERDGSAGKPLVLRRASGAAAGSVVVNGEIFLAYRQYVHIEGLTVNGRIRFNGSNNVAIVRNQVNASASVGNGDGIVTLLPAQNAYIADNTVVGVTPWADSSMGAHGSNTGQGIVVTGPGHVVMNNRVRGFRDTISLIEGEQALLQYSIDILNNELSESGDDAIQADFCHHNCRIMRNRITNAFVGMSAQPTLGGPNYFVRNAAYNIAYVGFKLYNGSDGDVVLHNTIVKNGDGFGAYPGATIRHLIARNNLFIGGAGGTWGGYSSNVGSPIYLYDLDTGTSSLDYNAYGSTNNTWTGRFGSTIRFATFAELKANTTEKNAVQVDMSTFATATNFPATATTQFSAQDLRPGSGAALDAGLVIANVNDGFGGAAPDLGAYERGQALPVYGPR